MVATVGKRAQSFTVGELSDERLDIDLAIFSGRRGDMMARLREIHEEGAGLYTDEGAMIVTYDGYLCGVPNLFITDATEAFRFKDRKQAESFVGEFGDALLKPQVLDHP